MMITDAKQKQLLDTLTGYYAHTVDKNIMLSSITQAKLTLADLLETDNPFYWLGVVLCTRGFTSIQIHCALAEAGAFQDYWLEFHMNNLHMAGYKFQEDES